MIGGVVALEMDAVPFSVAIRCNTGIVILVAGEYVFECGRDGAANLCSFGILICTCM